jgi:hypothetical protein
MNAAGRVACQSCELSAPPRQRVRFSPVWQSDHPIQPLPRRRCESRQTAPGSMPTYSKLTCLEATTQWRSGCLLTRPSWRHMQRRWREKQHSSRWPLQWRGPRLQPRRRAAAPRQSDHSVTTKRHSRWVLLPLQRSGLSLQLVRDVQQAARNPLDGRPRASSRASCARARSAAMAAAGGSCDIPQKRPRS